MTRYFTVLCGLTVLVFGTLARAQDAGDGVEITPGIKLAPNGVISVGTVSAEIGHFDSSWSVTEQHDGFQPAAPPAAAPTTQPSSHVVSGPFTTSAGVLNLSEHLDVADGAVSFSAAATSDKAVPTNALYLGFTLPTDSFGGKQITIDQQPLALSATPAKQGQSGLFDKEDVQEIDLPMSGGTLVITGHLTVHIQDDREWDNQQYSMRLQFDPASGDIKDSKLQFKMQWKPTAG